jgi:hypothetical protein
MPGSIWREAFGPAEGQYFDPAKLDLFEEF